MKGEEIFPVVNLDGTVIGRATRKECHNGSFLLHPVVHLHILRADGALLLQKRSMNKDIQPGKWDTAVGGHVDYGESIEQALRREVREELGLIDFRPVLLDVYPFRSTREYELVNTFYWIMNCPFEASPDSVEIEDVRFWQPSEIEDVLGRDVLTPNFEQEYQRLFSRIHDLL